MRGRRGKGKEGREEKEEDGEREGGKMGLDEASKWGIYMCVRSVVTGWAERRRE